MVQEAQAKSSHTEKMMNKFAKIYTPLVLITALLVFAVPAILAELKVIMDTCKIIFNRFSSLYYIILHAAYRNLKEYLRLCFLKNNNVVNEQRKVAGIQR